LNQNTHNTAVASADQAFEHALEHHRAGRLEQAETEYRELLRAVPDHADAMHLLGMLLNQTRRAELALGYLRSAIALRPGYATLHNNLGVVLLGMRRAKDAASSFSNAVAIKPDYAEAHNNRGFALFLQSNIDGAIAAYRKALDAKPFFAEALNHLGMAYRAQGRLQDAIACYRQSIGVNPGIAQSNSNLGNALLEFGDVNEAIAFCEKAIAIDPQNLEANNNFGAALFVQGRVDDAIGWFRRALEIVPDNADALHNLGGAYHAQGRYAEALACFQKVVEQQPANAAALHMIAAMTGAASERAPDQYVAKVFDDYAEQFDAHLVRELEYHTPELLVGMVREYATRVGDKWDVLDLGCGTGLAGAAIAPDARSLVGVDLSRKMLEKARVKGIYTRLKQAELLGMTRDEADASYDVVMATDVFIYVGRLDEVAREAKRLLRDGGLFAFSIEAMPEGESSGQGFRLSPSGRYVHAAAYLDALAAANGFHVRSVRPTPIRREQGVPVPGWLLVWER
jgi:predicted TPR repeat methyltransferase